MKGANSTEFEDNPEHAAVVFMPEISKTHLGGTMRLGSRPTLWQHDGSTIRALYGPGDAVDERHRHRYEVNPDLIERIKKPGWSLSARTNLVNGAKFSNSTTTLLRCVQFHPEFKSRPGRPSPPFLGLLKAASGRLTEPMVPSHQPNQRPPRVVKPLFTGEISKVHRHWQAC